MQTLSRTIIGNRATDAIAGAMRKVAGTPRVSRALRPGPGAPEGRGPRSVTRQPQGGRPPMPIDAWIARGIFPSLPDPHVRHAEDPLRFAASDGRHAGAAPGSAGFDIIIARRARRRYYGQPFLSKGFPEEAERV